MIHLALIEQTGQIDSGEEGADDTDDPSGGKSLDGTLTKPEQDDTGDDRRHVGVEDSREGIAVTGSHSLLGSLAGSKFLLGSFIDKHVGINSSTERQHHTGDTRHGKCGLERRQNTEREEEVDNQSAVGNHTGDEAVHGNHVDHQQHEGDDEGDDTLLDGLSTERRSYDFLLNNLCRSRHTTGLQSVGQVLGLLNGEITRDGRFATVDLLVDARSGVDHAVQYDGNGFAHIGFGQGGPAACALRVHRHAHLGLTRKVVELVFGIGHHVTLQRGTAVGGGHLQSVELIVVAELRHVGDGLCAPEQTQVAGQNLLCGRALQHAVDGCCIVDAGISHQSEAGIRHEFRKQRIALGLHIGEILLAGLGLAKLGSLLGSRGVGGRGVVATIGQTGIELIQIRHHLLGVVGLPELQVGTTLQELTHTLGLLDTRHLNHDTTFLAFELLDVGLNDAELVDTRTHDVERVVDGSLHFLAEHFLHVGIRTGGAHLALELLCGEDLGQVASGSVLVESVDEEIDKLTLSVLLSLAGLSNRLGESGVGLVVGERLDNVGHADFQDDVHTALQIQTEPNLGLQTLLIGVSAEVLHRILVILLLLLCLQLCNLPVVVVRSYRERQVKQTCKRQEDGNGNY